MLCVYAHRNVCMCAQVCMSVELRGTSLCPFCESGAALSQSTVANSNNEASVRQPGAGLSDRLDRLSIHGGPGPTARDEVIAGKRER